MEDAKVFVSHAEEEKSLALQLKEALSRQGIKAWSYERDIPFAENIAARIESQIAECDHLLVILSDAARLSEWVARELGLALTLQKQRGEPHPSILGVRCDSPCRSLEFWPREFRSGQPIGRAHDFSEFRYINLRLSGTPDDLTELVEQLLPKVTLISATDGDEGQLLNNSFRCYESLFPDEGERDDPADIEIWLDEGLRGMALYGDFPWREFYAVMHMEDHVVGMAYLTSHLKRHWCFGNYFGIKTAWRRKDRAQWFLDKVKKHVEVVDPGTKGVLFEVEPIDIAFLSQVAARETAGGYPDEEEIFTHLRRLRRLFLYQMNGALAVLGSDGRPLPYWQPAMCEGLDEKDERELILMVRLFREVEPKKLSLEEILHFIYDDLYGDAYGGLGSVEIPGYRSYLAQVKGRVESNASAGWKLGHVIIERPIRHLLRRVRAEGFAERLEL